MNQSIELLRKEKQLLSNKFGVEELGVFGSVARGNETINSDIDILVSFTNKTLHNYIALTEYLQLILNRKVDLVTNHKFLSTRFSKAITKDIIYV